MLVDSCCRYNQTDVVFSGPRVASVTATGTTVVVTYGPIGTEGGGLALRSRYGFEVCFAGSGCSLGFGNSSGASVSTSANTTKDMSFFAANITSSTATTVTITASPHTMLLPRGPSGAAIVEMIRYGYDDGPSLFTTPSTQPAVFNKAGLPQTPGAWKVGGA